MVRVEKLFEALQDSPASFRFRDFQRVIEAYGFRLRRVKGSHHIYAHPRVEPVLNIQPMSGKAKPYQIREFLDMVATFGLELDQQ